MPPVPSRQHVVKGSLGASAATVVVALGWVFQHQTVQDAQIASIKDNQIASINTQLASSREVMATIKAALDGKPDAASQERSWRAIADLQLQFAVSQEQARNMQSQIARMQAQLDKGRP